MDAKIPRISPAEIWARLGRGERITFLDARNSEAWASSDVKLPGAIRVPADAVEQSLPPERLAEPIVAYCT